MKRFRTVINEHVLMKGRWLRIRSLLLSKSSLESKFKIIDIDIIVRPDIADILHSNT